MHELSRFFVEELTKVLGLSRDVFTRLELTESNSNCTGCMNHSLCGPSRILCLAFKAMGNDIGGLLKDGQWVGIRPDDTTFVVNVGDTFMALTNGILHRAVYRVVVNAKRDRYSTVYFYETDNSIALTVPPELITEDRPFHHQGTQKIHRRS